MAGGVATIKGGFYEQYGTSLTQPTGSSSLAHRIARLLGQRGGMRRRALMLALDGVAPGATAAKTLSRIENNAELGGKRVVETETIVNRATTSADVTAINADTYLYSTRTTFGASPVANGDGNPLGTR